MALTIGATALSGCAELEGMLEEPQSDVGTRSVAVEPRDPAPAAPEAVAGALPSEHSAVNGGQPVVPGGGPVEPGTVFEAPPMPTSLPLPTSTLPPMPTPDPFAVAGRPVHMEVPALGIDTYVEQVGLTSDRAMDVPREWMNVAWYRRGYRPGETGNAVVAGHLDTNSGGPAVFWSLHELQPGDEVYITYENGDRYTFVVEGSEYYEHDAQGPIIDRIFGESLTADLNLITCDGAWDRGQATYSHRLVVFTTLVPEQTVRVDDSATVD